MPIGVLIFAVELLGGQQQLLLFHAKYDERYFLPIHIYQATNDKPVAVILRPRKTPDGREVRTILGDRDQRGDISDAAPPHLRL